MLIMIIAIIRVLDVKRLSTVKRLPCVGSVMRLVSETLVCTCGECLRQLRHDTYVTSCDTMTIVHNMMDAAERLNIKQKPCAQKDIWSPGIERYTKSTFAQRQMQLCERNTTP
jgi:hypothetical protein